MKKSKKTKGARAKAITKPGRRTAALKSILEALPGSEAKPMAMPRTTVPSVVIYKIKSKMFAILSLKGSEFVILKCDPNLVPVLKEQYKGVGHRSHLDRRNWIAVSLDADVPAGDVKRMVVHSYELVRSGLTRKQQSELALIAA